MSHHRRGLRRLLKDDSLLEAVEKEGSAAPLGGRRVALLRYAEKLSATPAKVQESDVVALRDEGFSDSDILAIAETVGYYAYANRIVSGLGVEIESPRPPSLSES